MKKIKKILLLTLSLAGALCLTAFAAGDGIYDVTTASGIGNVTLIPKAANGSNITATTTTINNAEKQLYTGAEQVELTYTGAANSSYYLALALSDDSATPTVNNIQYIDQNTATDNAVTFSIYPKELKANATYHLYLVSSDVSDKTTLTEVGSFTCYRAYIWGDADLDESVTSTDASLVLQHVARLITLEGNGLEASKVSGTSSVTSTDASLILQKVARLIDKFPVENT